MIQKNTGLGDNLTMPSPIQDQLEDGHAPVGQDDGCLASPTSVPTCCFCKATFNSDQALRQHKWEMIQKESKEKDKNPNKILKHVYCNICNKDFVSSTAGRQHWLQVSTANP